MLKETKIDITQTNMALFGTDVEKEIKKHAAEGEPAWKTAGKAPGIEVWRIEKFQIKAWPKDKYGHFFDGDSYIVLHTYKKTIRYFMMYTFGWDNLLLRMRRVLLLTRLWS